MNNSEQIWNKINKSSIQTVDNIITDEDNMLYLNQVTEVRKCKEDVSDYCIAIRSSKLKRILKACKETKENKFPVAEITLSFSTLFIGGTISALLSGVEYKNLTGFIAYTLCPIIGIINFTLFLLNRDKRMYDIKTLVKTIEENIDDSDLLERKEG